MGSSRRLSLGDGRSPHASTGPRATIGALSRRGGRTSLALVSESPRDAPAVDAPARLRGAAALRLHVTLLVGLALCAAAFIFELRRAEGGNELSWAYVFEWPLLGIFAIYMWWKFLHPGRDAAREAARARRRPPKPLVEPQYQGMLAAWEEHQRDLAARQAAEDATESPWRPGGNP